MKSDEYSKLMNVFKKAADELSEDLFRARIVRRNHSGDLGSQWATLRGVRLEHLAAPEGWLSRLSDGGGGHFSILVAHDKAPGVTLGEIMLQIPGPETKPQRAALERGDWSGPSVVDFLSGETSNLATSKTLKPDGTPAPASLHVTGRSFAESQLNDENRQLRDRLERAERAAEIERLNRAHKEDMERLRQDMLAREPRGPDPMLQMMVEQGKSQMTILTEMIKQSREDAARADERAREDARRADERALKMFEAQSQKKEDPLMAALVKSHFDDSGRNTKQFEGMATLTNLLMTSAMQMMTHQVEMTKQLQPATEEMGPVMRIAEKIADAALAQKTVIEPQKQLAGGQEVVEPNAEVDPDDTRAAWAEVEAKIHSKARAHEIMPALLVAIHGDPLRSLLLKHKGDMGDVVLEVFKGWVMESPDDRLKYVQTELVKVEMSLVAMNIVRPSKALQKHLMEQEAANAARAQRAATAAAAATASPVVTHVTPPAAPPAGIEVATPVQEAGKPFKRLAKNGKNGKHAETPPAEEVAQATAEQSTPNAEPVTA